MNPYQIQPRTLTNVASAKYALQMFDNEVSQGFAVRKQVEEQVGAIYDLLANHIPDSKEAMISNMDTLIAVAQLLGQVEGQRQALDVMKMNFISALPWKIRQELQSAG